MSELEWRLRNFQLSINQRNVVCVANSIESRQYYCVSSTDSAIALSPVHAGETRCDNFVFARFCNNCVHTRVRHYRAEDATIFASVCKSCFISDIILVYWSSNFTSNQRQKHPLPIRYQKAISIWNRSPVYLGCDSLNHCDHQNTAVMTVQLLRNLAHRNAPLGMLSRCFKTSSPR